VKKALYTIRFKRVEQIKLRITSKVDVAMYGVQRTFLYGLFNSIPGGKFVWAILQKTLWRFKVGLDAPHQRHLRRAHVVSGSLV
jgi:hypothetical protein